MQNNDIDIEPCPECPVPPQFIIRDLPSIKKEDRSVLCYGIECRFCGDKWTEVVDE